MERTDSTLIKLRKLIAHHGPDAKGRIPPERILATKLGVGRRSLRRALGVLESEGRIARHQGRGTFVQDGVASDIRPAAATALPSAAASMIPAPSAFAFESILDNTNPLEVIEVRLAIEPVMARLAAYRASQAEIKRLQILADETRLSADSQTYEHADARFHRTIAEVARNALFLAIFDILNASQRDIGWRRLGENAHCYKRQSVYADYHKEISAAIAMRDGDRAQEAMHQHLSDVQRYIYERAFPVVAPEQ